MRSIRRLNGARWPDVFVESYDGATSAAQVTVQNSVMPELSRFFGIIIRMFAEAGGQHYVAHFHAYW